MAFTKTELEMMYNMLDLLSSFHRGCNDYSVPATPENIEFCVDAELVTGDPDYPEDLNISDDGEKIYIMDFQIYGYLKHLIKKEIKSMETGANE